MKDERMKKSVHFLYGVLAGALFTYALLQRYLVINPAFFWLTFVFIALVSGWKWMTKDGVSVLKFLALMFVIGLGFVILALATCSFGTY